LSGAPVPRKLELVPEIPENKPSPVRPVRWIAILYGIGFGALALAVFALVMPIEWGEAKLRFRLWKAGARPVLWEKHRGFTQDRCGGRPASECGCVWFIHGMGDSMITWRNFFLTPDAFGGRPVRVFAIDLPGHGGSIRRRDPSEYRVSNMARELDAGIAKTPQCETNSLVGNSFGGWVAARMALESPKRYAHLILISPSGLARTERETENLFRDATVESLKDFQKRAYAKPRALSEKEWEAAVARLKRGAISEIRGAQVHEDRLDGDLPKIAVDTRVIWGEADRVVDREAMETFAKSVPHAVLSTIPACGHLPQKECPADLFPLIREALARPSAP
jgi:pimeloyl-ACP methyl ester carboxylesterase